MRAKQPDKSAFIERDGVKVHYECLWLWTEDVVVFTCLGDFLLANLENASAVFQLLSPLFCSFAQAWVSREILAGTLIGNCLANKFMPFVERQISPDLLAE